MKDIRSGYFSMESVFIGCAVRSGSTMLGAMLGSHDQCLCIPESQFKVSVLQELADPDGNVRDLQKALDTIRDNLRFRYWGLEIASAVPDGISSYEGLLVWIMQQYGRSVGRNDFRYCVDPTPQNIKFPEILFTLFPHAKMIHLVRDGRAVAASVMPLDWGPNTIDRAARSWKEKIRLGLRAEVSYGSARVIRVAYEDLVLSPEKTLAGLCSFLDIEFKPQMLSGSGFRVPNYTAKQHALVGRGPVAGRADSWKKELTRRQIEIFESVAGDMLRSLGYQLQFGGWAKKITVLEKVGMNIYSEYRRKLVNRRRRTRRVREGLQRPGGEAGKSP